MWRKVNHLTRNHLLWFIFFSTVFAAAELPAFQDMPVGARSLAMGGTQAGFIDTPDAVFLNPAGIAAMNSFGLSLFYQKPFGLQDVHLGTLAFAFPVSQYRFGLGVFSLGNDLYKEQKWNLTLARQWSNTIFVGLNLRWQVIKISRYGSTSRPGMDVGARLRLSKQVAWGVILQNINRPGISAEEQKLPQVLQTGFSFKATPQLQVNVDLYKDVRYTEEFRFGAEFSPWPAFSLRAGTATHPDRFSAGFGMAVRTLRLDYAFFTHNDLGLTHQLSVTFMPGKKQRKASPAGPPWPTNLPPEEHPAASRRINLNTATTKELAHLQGIGATLAKAIVAYRKTNGPFGSVEELLHIRGIGRATFERIKRHVFVPPGSSPKD